MQKCNKAGYWITFLEIDSSLLVTKDLDLDEVNEMIKNNLSLLRKCLSENTDHVILKYFKIYNTINYSNDDGCYYGGLSILFKYPIKKDGKIIGL